MKEERRVGSDSKFFFASSNLRALERASAFGISISGCKRGKVMGLCAYPEGSGACPVTCGTCGQ